MWLGSKVYEVSQDEGRGYPFVKKKVDSYRINLSYKKMLYPLLVNLFFPVLNDEHASGTNEQEDACQDEHVRFRSGFTNSSREEAENQSTKGGCYDLWQADGAVEQTEVGAHVSACQRIGQDGEGESQHGCPCASDEQEGDEYGIGIVDEVGTDEPYTTEYETEGIDGFQILETRNDYGPQDRTDGLDGKEYTHPVACLLILGGGGVE